MLTTERKLGEAVDMISSAPDSAMKQVQALQWFEKSLDCMYAHRYLECADGFEKCITLNNWSHGLVRALFIRFKTSARARLFPGGRV